MSRVVGKLKNRISAIVPRIPRLLRRIAVSMSCCHGGDETFTPCVYPSGLFFAVAPDETDSWGFVRTFGSVGFHNGSLANAGRFDNCSRG